VNIIFQYSLQKATPLDDYVWLLSLWILRCSSSSRAFGSPQRS